MKITRIPWYKKALGTIYPQIYSRGTGRADINTNGEFAFLEWLVSYYQKNKATFICFDVGANIGNYSRAILEASQKKSLPCEIHAFEPVSKSFTELKNIVMSSQNMFFPNNIALSDSTGEITMHYDEAGSEMASIYKRNIKNHEFTKSERVKMLTGQEYVANSKTKKINLLKIDVEGHELKVLNGFGDFLDAKNIDFIQFEYGGSSLDSHTTLKEIYGLLESRGFVLGRLLRDRIELRKYRSLMENYDYSNYIAISGNLLAKGKIK